MTGMMATKIAGEQLRHLDDGLPGKAVGLAVLLARERERRERDQDERAVAREVLQLKLGTVDGEGHAGLPLRRPQDGRDDGGEQHEIDGAAHADLGAAAASPTSVICRSCR